MNLIIVESPTKAKTISNFVPKNCKVLSSYGHVRDLPKSQLGVDTENNFEPKYIIPPKARKTVSALKKQAKASEAIILATDEDREGEAISWHLTQALDVSPNGEKKVSRIVFHEITKRAIEEALGNPRKIDMNLVDAQQARRILDRLVGYKLSPFLWKKIVKGLSAGRVQSVALRLIAEREQEIRNFKPEEYWTISAVFRKKSSSETFEAALAKIDGETIPKLGIKTKGETEDIVSEIKKCGFEITKIEKKETVKNPLPPFTTSTLQQEAAKRLRFSAKQTMLLAQNLYENGHITYMRTDSVNLSRESVEEARNWLASNLGEKYSLPSPRMFKTKSRLAQEAHEAIRPTLPNFAPQNLGGQAHLENKEKKLYELIWRRFVSCQMPQAIFDSTKVEVDGRRTADGRIFSFNAGGNILKFDGFLKIWPQTFAEKELPALQPSDPIELSELNPGQHFTEPPPRYTEASLVKTLEEHGIGRPSTYAPIISIIQERNYVFKNEQRRFCPTEIGEVVNKVLTEHFPEIVDIKFTAEMEENLDKIAQGEKRWQTLVKEFYEPFSQNLEKKYQEVSKKEILPDEKTDEKCELCGKDMVVRRGRFGKFLACSGYPECKNTKKLLTAEEQKDFGPCPKCKDGSVVARRTKKGRIFYGCSRYPACDHATWKLEKEKPASGEMDTDNLPGSQE